LSDLIDDKAPLYLSLFTSDHPTQWDYGITRIYHPTTRMFLNAQSIDSDSQSVDASAPRPFENNKEPPKAMHWCRLCFSPVRSANGYEVYLLGFFLD
jgi:hypothetical protein